MTYRVAVVTVSDGVAAGTREDRSGETAARMLAEAGFDVADRVVVRDDRDEIASVLERLTETTSLVVTTGGTGLAASDVTPEATSAVIERDAPGLAELVRIEGLRETRLAALSRGIAGVRGSTLIVNLPGSTAAVEQGLRSLVDVLPHALDLLRGRTEH